MANHPIFYVHTKHTKMKIHFVRGQIKDFTVEPVYVASTNQLVDLLMKSLLKHQQEYFQQYGVCDIFTPSNISR